MPDSLYKYLRRSWSDLHLIVWIIKSYLIRLSSYLLFPFLTDFLVLQTFRYLIANFIITITMVLTFPAELSHERRRELFNHMKYVVVKVHVEEFNTCGTGFFISDRYILTANHVLMKDENDDKPELGVPLLLASIYPCSDGSKDVQPLTAWVIRRDIFKDMALLQLDAPVDRDCVMLETGILGMWEEVYCICMPSGLEFSCFKANVSEPSSTAQELACHYDPDLLLFEIKGIAFPSLGGASGAPVFNAQGKVVGMLFRSSEFVTWAIRSEEISVFLNNFDYY